jgi:hypothetical protein
MNLTEATGALNERYKGTPFSFTSGIYAPHPKRPVYLYYLRLWVNGGYNEQEYCATEELVLTFIDYLTAVRASAIELVPEDIAWPETT